MQSSFVRRQLLTAAAACGVVATFGTPYGGILFSVELCSSVYLISNLFKAFVCGTVAFLVYQYFNQFDFYFDVPDKAPLGIKASQSITGFVFLGVIVGYLASALVLISGKLIQLKNSATIDVFRK